MAKRKEKWATTCERYVAFLDIMGFKDMVYRNSHEKVKTMLESIRPTIQSIEDSAKNSLSKKRKKTLVDIFLSGLPVVFPITFSDSILLISSDNSDFSANSIFSFASTIIYDSIDKGIPMKGAIAYGELTGDIDNSLYFGRPLIDAFELLNELQLYGVVLHHTVENRLKNIDTLKTFENKLIFKWNVPMKSGRIMHYILDLIDLQKPHIDITNDLVSSLDKLYNNVSGSARIYVDNTIEFINWISSRKAELNK
jgi:hypothetical protein